MRFSLGALTTLAASLTARFSSSDAAPLARPPTARRIRGNIPDKPDVYDGRTHGFDARIKRYLRRWQPAGGGDRECARRRSQIARGVLSVSRTESPK